MNTDLSLIGLALICIGLILRTQYLSGRIDAHREIIIDLSTRVFELEYPPLEQPDEKL